MKTNANSLHKFDHDNWVRVLPTDLNTGDIFSCGSTTAIFTSLSYESDATRTPVISAVPLDRGPITLQIGTPGSDWEFIVMTMDYCGSSCEQFPDGTAIIAEFDEGNTLVYSPRLPLAELNRFCDENMAIYENFYSTNRDCIDDGKKIPIKQFWKI